MERRKALVIGINDYKSSPLKCCVNDAKSVVALLEKMNINHLTLL